MNYKKKKINANVSRHVELSPIQSKRGDKFYLFFLIVNIAGGFVQIIVVIRAEIQIDTNLAVVR